MARSDQVHSPGLQSLGTAEASSSDGWRAILVAGALLIAFLITAPFAQEPWRAVPGFVPTYNMALIVIDLIIALLLFIQYRELGECAFLVLTCGYIFTPAIIAAHSLSFPDAFVPGSLIGGSQTTAWLWMVWHVLFPLFVAGYALLARDERRPGSGLSLSSRVLPSWPFVLATIAFALICILLTTAGENWLPPLMTGSQYRSSSTRLILLIGWLATLSGLVVLVWVTQLKRLIDLWLGVMMIAWLIDLALSAILTTGRYQAGFYIGRVYGLIAAAIVLASLLRQAAGAYSGLARSAHIARLNALRASQAEAARRDTEGRYRTLFESIDEGFYFAEAIFDAKGRCMDIYYLDENPAAIRMVGKPAKGRRMSDLGAYEQYWRDIFGEVARTREAKRLQHYAAPNRIWFDFYVFKPPHAGKNQFAVIFQDITERKRTEDALRRSEERHRLIVESARDYGIFTMDAQGRIDSWSPGAEALYGWSADETVGQDTAVLFIPEDRESGEPEKERLAARKDGYAPDVRWHLRKNGSCVFIDGFMRSLHDANGDIRGFLKIGRDVTERRAIDQALRESEERFRQFAEASSDILWIRNAQTLEFEYLSPAFEAVYGEKRENMLGDNNVRQWARLIFPQDRERALDAVRSVRAGHRATHEFRILRPPAGEVRWMRNTDFPLLDDAGRVQRVAGISRDITEEKQAEERQRLLLGELQHRVRNILAVIRSMASRTAQTSETVRHYVANLTGRIGSLARTQALLTRTLGAGVDLRKLIQEELQAQSAQEEQLSIDGPELRLAPKAAEVLTLAIHELATNATKYGALAKVGARLAVSWDVRENGNTPWLRLVWRERGVRDVSPPLREGFGSELIKRRVPYELGGRGSIVMQKDGVECVIEFPLIAGDSVLQTDMGVSTDAESQE